MARKLLLAPDRQQLRDARAALPAAAGFRLAKSQDHGMLMLLWPEVSRVPSFSEEERVCALEGRRSRARLRRAAFLAEAELIVSSGLHGANVGRIETNQFPGEHD